MHTYTPSDYIAKQLEFDFVINKKQCTEYECEQTCQRQQVEKLRGSRRMREIKKEMKTQLEIV
jgi:hypothetical protein